MVFLYIFLTVYLDGGQPLFPPVLSFFISLFYQIYKYEDRNELLVFWTNGIKKINFINAVLLYAIIILILQTILGSYFSPFFQNKARSFIRDSNIDFFSSLIKEGKFIDTVSNLTIFIESKDSNGEYKNIFLNDSRPEVNNNEGSQTIYAKRGRLISKNDKKYFVLFDGNIIHPIYNQTFLLKKLILICLNIQPNQLCSLWFYNLVITVLILLIIILIKILVNMKKIN